MLTRKPFIFETLEERRLLSASISSITLTSAIAGTPANVLIRAEKATITANGVTASSDDKVSTVTYFVDLNNDGVPDKGDKILGASDNAAKNFPVKQMLGKTVALGPLTISAIARGKLGKTDLSPVATDVVTVANDTPAINHLASTGKKVVAGKKLTITASTRDKDGAITNVEFWIDSNGNGKIDPTDLDLGAGTQVGKGASWKFNVDTSIATFSSTLTFLAQATDNDGSVSPAANAPGVAVSGFQIAPLSVTSASNSTPVPLTTLTLATTGLNPANPVSVNFSNSAGFSVSDQPIRVDGDGTVVVAVPLYVDPTSQDITAGTVSMVLTQGASSSTPISLDIQNLPTLDTYGMKLGDISHAFLVMDAILLGKRLNELQAAQLVLNGQVDTSQAQTTTTTLLNNAVLARNDVDRISLDNSTVITDSSNSSGTPIQFDKNSQDIMDRVIAVYLTQLAKVVVPPQSVSSVTVDLASLIAKMETINGVADITKAAQDLDKSHSWLDSGTAIAKGLNGYMGLGAADLNNAPLGLISKQIGGCLAVFDVVRDLGEMSGDLAFLYFHSGDADPAVLQQATNDINNVSVKTYFDSVGTLISAGELFLNGVESTGALAIQGLKLAVTTAQFIHDGQETASDETSGQVADAISASPFSSSGTGLAQINGTANIMNDQGIASAQSSLDLGFFGASALGIQGVADPAGDYSLFVPLAIPGTDYSSLTINVTDPITNTNLGSEVVDLTGLDASHPIQVPPVTGSCTDGDALNPDSDDPDCD